MTTNVCIEDALLSSIKEVFEAMVFMEVEPTEETAPNFEGDSVLASINFAGNLKGCISICCTWDCAKEVASNMLGIDPDEGLSPEEICDAIGEITNMIMGKVELELEQIYGPLKASIPSVTAGVEFQNKIGDGTQRYDIKLSLEDIYAINLSLICEEN